MMRFQIGTLSVLMAISFSAFADGLESERMLKCLTEGRVTSLNPLSKIGDGKLLTANFSNGTYPGNRAIFFNGNMSCRVQLPSTGLKPVGERKEVWIAVGNKFVKIGTASYRNQEDINEAIKPIEQVKVETVRVWDAKEQKYIQMPIAPPPPPPPPRPPLPESVNSDQVYYLASHSPQVSKSRPRGKNIEVVSADCSSKTYNEDLNFMLTESQLWYLKEMERFFPISKSKEAEHDAWARYSDENNKNFYKNMRSTITACSDIGDENFRAVVNRLRETSGVADSSAYKQQEQKQEAETAK